MNPIRKRAALVATVLLCFVILTYRYSNVSPSHSVAMTHPPTPKSDNHPKPIEQITEIVLSKVTTTEIVKTFPPKPQTLPPEPKKPLIKVVYQRQFNRYLAKDVDHFVDWPTPFEKSRCPKSYELQDISLAIVIYMKDELDSFPMQTYLSTVQFSKESGISISNVVLTFKDNIESQATHRAYATSIRDLATGLKPIPIITTSAHSEWKAKLAGVKLANSEQVLLIDDTNIVDRGFIKPLMSTLEKRPRSLITPHIDSLLPVRVYTLYKDKKLHPDGQVWQERDVATFHVITNMTTIREDKRGIQKLPMIVPSGGANGEVLAARRTWLLSVLSKMQTDDVAELSLLSYMCGDGVVVNKCSAVVRSNNYDLVAPITKDPVQLQRLYPLYDKNPDKLPINGCKDVKHYFNEVKRIRDRRW